SAWKPNRPPTPTTHAASGSRRRSSGFSRRSSQMPSDSTKATLKLSAASRNGGTRPLAPVSQASVAHSRIAPPPKSVAARADMPGSGGDVLCPVHRQHRTGDEGRLVGGEE